jgi:hypothetical protein
MVNLGKQSRLMARQTGNVSHVILRISRKRPTHGINPHAHNQPLRFYTVWLAEAGNRRSQDGRNGGAGIRLRHGFGGRGARVPAFRGHVVISKTIINVF